MKTKRSVAPAVLDEVADAYRRVLKRHKVTEPDDGADLHVWADSKKETKARGTRRGFRRTIFMAGFALREIRDLRAILANGGPDLNDLVDRLLFVCGPKGEVLQGLFADTGHVQAADRGRQTKHERYWERRLPLVEKAIAFQEQVRHSTDHELTNLKASEQVIHGLDGAAWADLMVGDKRRRIPARTPEAVAHQARKLAKLLGMWRRPDETTDEDDWDLDDVRARIAWRQAVREFPKSAVRPAAAPDPGQIGLRVKSRLRGSRP